MKFYPNSIGQGDDRCDLEHYDTDSIDELDDSLIKKAHALCWLDGKIVIVNHPKWDIWGIPGGSREEDEEVIDTLAREIIEEANCRIESYIPIAYQKILLRDGTYLYHVQYFCKVSKIGDFESDIAGSIDKIHWIEPGDYVQYIEEKPFKRDVFERFLQRREFYENF